jgi:hypothetical protein
MEERWNSEVVSLMLSCLRGRVSNRKLRLFACACCRRIERLIYPPWDQVLEAAERYADGQIGYPELQAIRSSADPVHDETMAVEAAAMPDDFLIKYADDAAGYADQAVASEAVPGYPRNVPAWQGAQGREEPVQRDLLRDIFGNPFRSVALDPAWLTAIVVLLAQSAYDERLMPSGCLDSARLGVLADALEEAGCTEQAILDHLRGPGPHVRGCWAVDLLLGKE